MTWHGTNESSNIILHIKHVLMILVVKFSCSYTYSDKYSLKRGCKVLGHSFVTEVMATVSWHFLDFPLAAAIHCQLPELQFLCGGNTQSQADHRHAVYFLAGLEGHQKGTRPRELIQSNVHLP